MLNVKFDKLKERALRKKLFGYGTAIQKAIAGAVNDTTKQLRTAASKEIRAVLNLKKKAVDARIHRFFISARRGGIRIRAGRPISLSNLTRKPRQTKTGVAFQLRKGQTTLIPHAFGPKITKLHNSVYVRTGTDRKPLNIKQYVDLYGDMHSLGVVFRLNKSANELMQKNIKRRMNLLKLRQQGKVK